jgi:hypothetical protein
MRLLSAAILCAIAGPATAQWLDHPTPGIPRLPDGRPDLRAPAPRLPDGRPDLSGLWFALQPYIRNDTPGAVGLGEIPFQPWALELYQQRLASGGRDDPSARCIPAVPRINGTEYPFRIVMAPGRVVILYELYRVWREIFTDGRALPVDPTPTWMGYSVGHWEGDVFVVRSSGFNGKVWLSSDGWPSTDALQVTERFRRRDFGHMELEITIDDPKAYLRPWTAIVPLVFYADTEMMEYVCMENNKFPALVPQH